MQLEAAKGCLTGPLKIRGPPKHTLADLAYLCFVVEFSIYDITVSESNGANLYRTGMISFVKSSKIIDIYDLRKSNQFMFISGYCWYRLHI